MTVTHQESSIIANHTAGTFNDSVDEGGTLHQVYFTHEQSGAGDATSDVKVVKLPPGRVRLMLGLSAVYVNWTTASATLDIGWDAYTDFGGNAVDADPNGLVDGLDVDTVGIQEGQDLVTALTSAAAGTKIFESQEGVTITFTSQDEVLADSSDLAGYLVYAKD